MMEPKGTVAKANGIDIWYETFGDKKDPAFLLLMGGCCQAVLWPVDFCTKLSEKGFFVIRFDYRDAGLSTCFDFEVAPYTFFDMAKDAIGLLDSLKIQKAHLFGLSTGGALAQVLAAHFPSRVETIALIATSCDFRPLNKGLGLHKNVVDSGSLSPPSKRYFQAMDTLFKTPAKNNEEALTQRMTLWQVLNGSKIPLPEASERAMHELFLKRLRYPEGLNNHLLANVCSEELLLEASNNIHVPTIIFQGSEDPIFQIDHGQELHRRINGSTLYILQGHGHVPNPYFFDFIIDKLLCTKSLKEAV